MLLRFRHAVRTALAMLLVPLLPCCALAGDHIVTSADLHQELLQAAQSRQANISKVQQFLSSDAAQQVLRTAKVDSAKVKEAIPTLSDEELARLANRVDQTNFPAGRLTTTQTTYIILGAILVILVAIIALR